MTPRRIIAYLAALALGVLAIVPTRIVESLPSLCLIKGILSHECYGCGMTRALSCLLHGNLTAALAYNRGSVAILPLLLGLALSSLFPLTPELRTALSAVWAMIGLILLGVLIVPWAVSPAQVASVVPACEWKARYHRECAFCGLTTAFFAIRHGRFEEAEHANRGAIPLYAAFLLNEAGLLLFFQSERSRPC